MGIPAGKRPPKRPRCCGSITLKRTLVIGYGDVD
jgi:hypothetical protein